MDPRIDALALLFLAFAHATDGTLSGEEMRLLAAKLRAWQPDATLEVIGEQIKGTVERYKALGDRAAKLAEAERCAVLLAQSLDPEPRAQVLADLRAIAEVDGAITPEESAFLDLVAKKFA